MITRKDSIITILKDMTSETQVSLWNLYCNEQNADDYIYDNDEYQLSEMFSGPSAVIDALRAVSYGDYRFTDEYVKFNAYGNLVSFDSYDVEEYIDFDELADYLMENGDENDNFDDEDLSCLKDDFIAYYEEKTGKTFVEDDNFDCIGYDFITTDWDEIIEELSEWENEDE